MPVSKKNITNAGIFAAILLGILFPAPMWLKKTLPFALGLLLTANFAKIEFDMKKFLRKELLYFPAAVFTVIPFVVYFSTFWLPADIRMGLFIMAVTPSAIASPVVVGLIGGDRELSVSHVVVTNLISPLAYSLLIFLYFRKETVGLSIMSIFYDIALLLAVPFVVSRLLSLNSKIKEASGSFFSMYTPFGFLLIIFIAVASSSIQLRSIGGKMLVLILAASAVLAALNFATGFFLSKVSVIRKTLSVEFGHKNTSLSIWLALSSFSPAVVLPMVSYLVFHHVINGVLVNKYNR